ncbi:MAG: cation:proton antiporter, partial [Gemmatimonadetes bacterium]|nr:cation:proton antiporter [Gemmatimonadota bacterium]
MPGNLDLAIHLFLQLTVILIVCRVAGRLLRRLGQTQVVSEMVAGVLLGPSLLGLLWPEAQAFLFPPNVSMSILYALSQVGLVLYMFLIGLNLSTSLLVAHSRDALWVSVSGVAVPVVMGGAMGAMLAGDAALFAPAVRPWQAALFMAAAMAITAFPMLARILYESGMAQTRIGTLAIGAAAFDDATAWCLLAAVVASLQGQPGIAALAVGGGAA